MPKKARYQKEKAEAEDGYGKEHTLAVTNTLPAEQNAENHGHIDWSWNPVHAKGFCEETELLFSNWFAGQKAGAEHYQPFTPAVKRARREYMRKVKQESAWESLRNLWVSGGA